MVYDARGHLIEPHTGHSIGLGTTEVADYLAGLGEPTWSEPSGTMPEIRTHGPSGRYGALLFCEKEGFNELFDAVLLAERYDIALLSSKGVSNTAARRLIDKVCARYGIPVFVLHDFDVSGSDHPTNAALGHSALYLQEQDRRHRYRREAGGR